MQIQDAKNTASSTEPVDFSSPSLSLSKCRRVEEFLTQSRSTCKVHCLKTITLNLPQFIYDIRISLDNYWL